MTTEELQTLLDINSSSSFQELQSRTASRLSALQKQFANQGFYDEKTFDTLNDLYNKK